MFCHFLPKKSKVPAIWEVFPNLEPILNVDGNAQSKDAAELAKEFAGGFTVN